VEIHIDADLSGRIRSQHHLSLKAFESLGPCIECLSSKEEKLVTATVSSQRGLRTNPVNPLEQIMPLNFSTTIPTDPRGMAFPIERTPAHGKLVAAVTSENLIGTYTHFWKGHTMPCTQPDCEAHDAGIPFRWHGYVAALSNKNSLHFIFEFTAQAADTFDQYRKAHGTLRGCRFEATRLHSRFNGRVILTCRPLDQQQYQLPTAPDVAACMAIIWNIPAGDMDTNRKVNGRPGMSAPDPTLDLFPRPQPQPVRKTS